MSQADDQGAIAFLEELVSLYTPSGHEAPVAERAVEWMRMMGMDARVDAAGNAVGHCGSGMRRLVMLGHIDTVPGELPVYIEDGVLHGRGSVDAKGPFAAFCMAAARCQDIQGLQVTVIGAVEEEAATSKGAYYAVEHYPRPDAVIIGEPSNWRRITLGYKGRLLVDYMREQSMSHTAGQATSVCEQAVAYWQRLADYADAWNADKERQFDRLDPSLRSINSATDGLFEQVAMRIGLRLPLGLDIDALENELYAWADDAQVTLSGRERPWRGGKRNPLTRAFLASIRAQGQRAAFVSKTGTSDMNVLGPRWQCPIVAYGPGDASLDHTPEERIDLDEYLRSIQVLEGVLRRLSAPEAWG